jgi:hypothetical protein
MYYIIIDMLSVDNRFPTRIMKSSVLCMLDEIKFWWGLQSDLSHGGAAEHAFRS